MLNLGNFTIMNICARSDGFQCQFGRWIGFVLIGMLIACDDDPVTLQPTTMTGPAWAVGLDATSRGQLEAYEAEVIALAAAEADETGDVDALRAALRASQDAIDRSLEPARRRVVSAALARRFQASAQNDALGDAGRRRRHEAHFELFVRLDRGGNYAVYREILHDLDADPFVRVQAGDGMARDDAPRALQELASVLGGESSAAPQWQAPLVDIGVRHGGPLAGEWLATILRASPDEQVKIRAAFVAREHPHPSLVAALRHAAESDPFPYVRINAAQTLALLVGPPCRPWLESLRAAATGPLLPEGLNHAIATAISGQPGPLAVAW